MIDDADSEEDLLLVVNVLRTFLKSNYTMTEDFSTCVTAVLGSCYVLDSVRVANELVHDPELSQFLLGTTSHLRYMMLGRRNSIDLFEFGPFLGPFFELAVHTF